MSYLPLGMSIHPCHIPVARQPSSCQWHSCLCPTSVLWAQGGGTRNPGMTGLAEGFHEFLQPLPCLGPALAQPFSAAPCNGPPWHREVRNKRGLRPSYSPRLSVFPLYLVQVQGAFLVKAVWLATVGSHLPQWKRQTPSPPNSVMVVDRMPSLGHSSMYLRADICPRRCPLSLRHCYRRHYCPLRNHRCSSTHRGKRDIRLGEPEGMHCMHVNLLERRSYLPAGIRIFFLPTCFLRRCTTLLHTICSCPSIYRKCSILSLDMGLVDSCRMYAKVQASVIEVFSM
jgi:hypothetical protein